MIAQLKQDLCSKSFSHQDQDKRDDGLQKRNYFWPNYVVKKGRPTPNYVYENEYKDPGISCFFWGSKYDSELRELKKIRDRWLRKQSKLL